MGKPLSQHLESIFLNYLLQTEKTLFLLEEDACKMLI